MIAVTHLLGTGHLSRALTLAQAFRDRGHEVLLASGGMPVPHLKTRDANLLQLPPVRSDGTEFTRLLDDRGSPVTTAYLGRRTAALLAGLRDFGPDCLICELFPFGRRVLSEEFLALLDAARQRPGRPVILCSIRDILAPPSKPSKAERAEAIVAACFDAVLVHSDPAATRLEASWPVSPGLQRNLRYTGYVAPPPAGPHPDRAGEGEILVTAGGGPVGDRLYRATLQSAAQDLDRTWRLLVGGTDGADRIAALAREAPQNAVVEAVRPDFRQMLFHAAASVGMCGYNTTLDLLQAGTPAVLVPFDDGNEVEQGLRAKSLAHLPGLEVVASAALTPARILDALSCACAEGRRAGSGLHFNGASETVRIAEEMEARRA